MKKFYLFLLFVFATLAFLSGLDLIRPALAAVTCTTQYGGGQTCVTTGQLLVNKRVWNPDTNQMVDNLTVNDHQFKMGDEITFSIDVKNVGDATINNINFSDTLPGVLTWTSGDLNSNIDSLAPGQTRTFTVKAKVNNNSTGCVLNTATAAGGGTSDSDTSQVCLKGTMPKEMPKAGAEGLILLLPLGSIGIYLKNLKLPAVAKGYGRVKEGVKS